MIIYDIIELVAIFLLVGIVVYERRQRFSIMVNVTQLAHSIITLRTDLHHLSKDLESVRLENVGISNAIQNLTAEAEKLEQEVNSCKQKEQRIPISG